MTFSVCRVLNTLLSVLIAGWFMCAPIAQSSAQEAGVEVAISSEEYEVSELSNETDGHMQTQEIHESDLDVQGTQKPKTDEELWQDMPDNHQELPVSQSDALLEKFGGEDFVMMLLLVGVGYLLPAFFILRDKRVSIEERVVWLLATFFVSWFAFLLFLWVAPLFKKNMLVQESSREEGADQSMGPVPGAGDKAEPSDTESQDKNGVGFEVARHTLTAGISIASVVAFVVGCGMLATVFDKSSPFFVLMQIPVLGLLVLAVPFALMAPAVVVLFLWVLKLLVTIVKKYV